MNNKEKSSNLIEVDLYVGSYEHNIKRRIREYNSICVELSRYKLMIPMKKGKYYDFKSSI